MTCYRDEVVRRWRVRDGVVRGRNDMEEVVTIDRDVDIRG